MSGEINTIILVAFAFLPPIIYAIWIRNKEKYNKEKWFPLSIAFIWAASIAVLASLILEFLLSIPLAFSFYDIGLISLIIASVIAPFAEELTKPLSLYFKRIKIELDEPEDGLIFGAVAGLGFSATENLFYGMGFMSEGDLGYFISMMFMRSIGACLLHASATAWTGYGIGKMVMEKKTISYVFPYFLIAFFMHGVYNFVLSFDIFGALFGLIIAFGFTFIMFYYVIDKIKKLDNIH